MEKEYKNAAFWRYFNTAKEGKSDDECWIVEPDGSGKVRSIPYNGRGTSIYRAVAQIFLGPIPEGKIVAHECDERFCVNPAHLRYKTPSENTQGAVNRGRLKLIPNYKNGAVDHWLNYGKEHENSDGCWVIPPALGGDQPKKARKNGKDRYIYVHVAEMYLGPKPENMVIMHICDNRHCVNPAHLKYGTVSENMVDMHEKGRANHSAGENHGAAKLTEEDVRQARKLKEETGISYEKLARMFGITSKVMRDAINRKTWRHVT
jgi:hypothetical protein